ncbi:hypothetical protein PIB30_075002 [Stylosanthes scabra]|uniref:Uncharacterized protein n=1 Tax=Stylosanthes scabra TaxID=79078 RepID=A0ABU6WPJ0_9FABA|nr:hypothetical protein [Stylosanthes scabra]
MSQINEGGETIQGAARSASEAAIGSSDKTKMFDSFETVSLGRNDSNNVLQAEPEQQGKTKDAEVEVHGAKVEVHGAEVEVPAEQENVVEEKQQPEPLSVIMHVQPQQDDEGKDLAMTETNEDAVQPIEVEPVPIINIPIPLEHPEPEPCSLTLRPWLQPEPETSTAKGPVDSPDKIVT